MYRLIRRMAFLLQVALFFSVPVHARNSQQKALLIGGGTRPLAALKYLKSWSAGKLHSESVLIVTWASSMPEEAFAATSQDLKAAGYSQTQEAVRSSEALDRNARLIFLKQLSQSATIFFAGGDQVEFMRVAKSMGVTGDLQKAYHEGMAFAGTSAGTAVMAHEMFTGDEDITVIKKSAADEMAAGVGIFESLLIDQHFVKRMRWARLFSALLNRPEKSGLGVDENTALALETVANGDLQAKVFGEGTVISVTPDGAGLKTDFYQEGETFKVPRSRNSVLK